MSSDNKKVVLTKVEELANVNSVSLPPSTFLVTPNGCQLRCQQFCRGQQMHKCIRKSHPNGNKLATIVKATLLQRRACMNKGFYFLSFSRRDMRPSLYSSWLVLPDGLYHTKYRRALEWPLWHMVHIL
jgi:hypothetical protein